MKYISKRKAWDGPCEKSNKIYRRNYNIIFKKNNSKKKSKKNVISS